MLDFFVNDCPFVLLFFLIIKNNNDELKEWKFNQTKILTGEVFLNPSNSADQNIFSTSRICLLRGFIEMRTSRKEGPVNNQINAESHKFYSFCRNVFFQNLFLTLNLIQNSQSRSVNTTETKISHGWQTLS